MACQSLRDQECRTAIAGGVNVMLRPDTTINFCRARMLAPDGRCKTFDARADGYTRGEGAGIVVLKRLSHAIEDGDRVLAVLLGSAVNQDGRTGGLTVPNGSAQQALIREALQRARVRPNEVSYVEAHGTGTSLGDPIEVHSLCAVLGEGRAPNQTLTIGSAKTNIGHLEAAAGVAGLIKVVLALQHDSIPRHLHFETLNPYIDVGAVPLEVATEARPWASGTARRVAGVSAFGFSGTNAHVIVAEAPAERSAPGADVLPHGELMLLSARTLPALQAQARRLADYAESERPALADVAFTLGVGRAHLPVRMAFIARNQAEFLARLRALSAGSEAVAQVRALPGLDPVRVAWYFPDADPLDGQRLRALAASSSTMATHVESLDGVLAPRFGATWQENESVASLALQSCLAELLAAWGMQPAVVAGTGVGAIVAARVAGAVEPDVAAALLAGWIEWRDRGTSTGLAAAASCVHELQVGMVAPATGAPIGVDDLRNVGFWTDRTPLPGEMTPLLSNDIGLVALAGGTRAAADAAKSDSVISMLHGEASDAWNDVVAAAGALHCAGAALDWQAFHAARDRRRVALPTYPFERQRYWIDSEAAVPVEAVDAGVLARQLADAFAGERDDILVSFIRTQVAAVLGISAPGTIDRRQRLIDLGLDSLMVLEVRNRIERGLEWKDVLPPTLVFDYPTIDVMLPFLESAIDSWLAGSPSAKSPATHDGDEAAAPARTGAAAVADRIAEMSDEDVEALLMQKLASL
jgi:acyl transferase domain-containing protein